MGQEWPTDLSVLSIETKKFWKIKIVLSYGWFNKKFAESLVNFGLTLVTLGWLTWVLGALIVSNYL